MRKILLISFLSLLAFTQVNAQLDSTSLLTHPNPNSTSYLSIPTPEGSNLRVNGSFTIEAWVLPNDSEYKESFVVETYDAPYMGGFVLRVTAQNTVRAYKMGDSASQTVSISGTTPLTMNQWNHIAMKYDSEENTLTVYLNGAEDGVTPCNTNVVNLNPAMKIGARGDNNLVWKAIQIDDVRIWNYARTTEEINTNKNVCVDGTETGLLAAYDFEGLTNSTVIDNSVNGNNGTIINFTSQNIQQGVTQCEMPCPNGSIDVQGTCAPNFTWINGVTYSANNNTATHVLTNVEGCDSTITLNLTFNPTYQNYTQNSVCEPYTWHGTTYSTAGTYSWLGTSALGCDSTVILQLNFFVPVSNIIHYNGGLISNDELLSATYQWIDCSNNQPIEGGANGFFIPPYDGSFALITTVNDCSETSECLEVTTLGINENEMINMTVYPNPVTDVLTIESQVNVKQVELYSITGQLLQTITPQSNVIKLDVAPYGAGVYIVKIENSNGYSTTNRVVKK